MSFDLADLSAGDEIPEMTKEPTRPQLFRYSAITWNAHRIHYDPEHAKEEGHPDVLVQSHLHGAFIQEFLMNWLGTHDRLRDLSWQNVGRAIPDEPLHVGAKITATNEDTGTVELEVWTRNEQERCAEGTAVVEMD